MKLMKQKRFLPLNLQHFADGAADTGADGGNGAADNHDSNTDQEKQQNQPLSFDDFLKDSKNQAEFDRRVNKALKTAKSKWEIEQQENMDEAKKLEKMNEEQRERYKFKKEKEQFDAKREQFVHEQLVVSTGKELLKRGLDAAFAEYLTADNAENTATRIDAFEQKFNEALSAALNSRMKGKAPKAAKPNKGYTREQIANMSPAEINANWKDIQESLKNV